MKKNYFMLAATTMMFAACAQTDVVNEIATEETPQAIGFETFAGKLTRAAENSTETETQGLENHHDNFKVWGYKNTATAYVFDGIQVKSDGDGTWSYSPTKYWDKAANTYEFYAAAPADSKWVLEEETAAQGDNYFTYADYELQDETLNSTALQESFKTLTKNKDLLIASPAQVNETDILNAASVNLEFNHILSRLNVSVEKDNTLSADVVLKSISVRELINIASFSEKTAAVQAGTTERWNRTGNKYNLTGNPLALVTTSPLYVLQSLIIPQPVAYQDIDRDGSDNISATAPYLYIEYTIGGEPFNASYNLANAFGSTGDDVPFNEAYQNTLHIKINATAIEFDAITFKWEDKPAVDKNID